MPLERDILLASNDSEFNEMKELRLRCTAPKSWLWVHRSVGPLRFGRPDPVRRVWEPVPEASRPISSSCAGEPPSISRT